MHKEIVIYSGNENDAAKALIMLHGRGSSAEDILGLSSHLNVKDYLLAAPQATGGSWYPQSFLAPPQQNEPWLSSALNFLKNLVSTIEKKGIKKEQIFLLGFSQGACLTLEFVTRNASKYGGIVAFTGGLIGDKIYTENYKGDFEQTPVFIGTGNPDFHVPVERVYATSNILKNMNAVVTEKVYDGMGHIISRNEISQANAIIFNTTNFNLN